MGYGLWVACRTKSNEELPELGKTNLDRVGCGGPDGKSSEAQIHRTLARDTGSSARLVGRPISPSLNFCNFSFKLSLLKTNGMRI